MSENQKLSIVNLLLVISRIERESENNITENEEAYIGVLLFDFDIRLWNIKNNISGKIFFKGCGEYMTKYGIDRMLSDLRALDINQKESLRSLVNEFSECNGLSSSLKNKITFNIIRTLQIPV